MKAYELHPTSSSYVNSRVEAIKEPEIRKLGFFWEPQWMRGNVFASFHPDYYFCILS